MYSEEKKICKFNLIKKCKYGENCKFRHVNICEINQIIVELQYLKTQNDLLKKEVQKMNKTMTNSKNNQNDASPNGVHACGNRMYSSLFKEDNTNSPAETSNKKIFNNKKNCNITLEQIHNLENKLMSEIETIKLQQSKLNDKQSNLDDKQTMIEKEHNFVKKMVLDLGKDIKHIKSNLKSIENTSTETNNLIKKLILTQQASNGKKYLNYRNEQTNNTRELNESSDDLSDSDNDDNDNESLTTYSNQHFLHANDIEYKNQAEIITTISRQITCNQRIK